MERIDLATLLELIENHPRINFRELMILSEHSAQDIWSTLVELEKSCKIESVKISNITPRFLSY